MGIAWKKMGKKFTHPHFWIENEDGLEFFEMFGLN
jgi:hypothetical protein